MDDASGLDVEVVIFERDKTPLGSTSEKRFVYLQPPDLENLRAKYAIWLTFRLAFNETHPIREASAAFVNSPASDMTFSGIRRRFLGRYAPALSSGRKKRLFLCSEG